MGILLGLIASASFGLIPFFALPLIHAGMPEESVLFYRFLIASTALGLLLIVRRDRLHAPWRDLLKLAGMSSMYTISALLLFWGFAYAPSGVATTLHFLYPVLVMLLMTCFFHEKFSWLTLIAVLLAVVGVALLSGGGGGERPVQTVGVVMLVASALCNALYITGIHVSRLTAMSGLAVTFYVMLFSAVLAFISAKATGTFRPLASLHEVTQLLMLSLVTAVLSNLTLVLAVKRIGSTLASVLGAMEPLTAVCVGIFVFHEPNTLKIMGGVALIVGAMLAVMLGPQLRALGRRWTQQ